MEIFLISNYVLLLLTCCVRAFDDRLHFEDELSSRKEADKVLSLPGLDKPTNFDMYAGYLDATPEDHLFYWLMECQDKSSETLILWFNGGPGCSSLDGMFYEHGPFKFDENTGGLIKNPYSWNKLGHVLYVESPVGTGFSYTTNQDNERIDDDASAETNLLALKSFFRKFPEYRNYLFYIAGESYAGVYIPLLTRAIIEEDSEMRNNLQGVLIGNGLLNLKLNLETLIEYLYYHGLISPVNYNEIKRLCKKADYKHLDNVKKQRAEDECSHLLNYLQHELRDDGLNIYNYAKDCTYNNEEAAVFETSVKHLYGAKENLGLIPPCSNATFSTRYLNRADVQESIHAKLRGNTTSWQVCSDSVTKDYNAIYPDMSPVFKEIINEMPFLKIVLFFGDLDLACNYLGGELFTDGLGYPITTPRRKWTVEKNGQEQLAGFYKEYDSLMFVTFKAAGHMVPTDKPAEAFQMLRRVLNDEPL